MSEGVRDGLGGEALILLCMAGRKGARGRAVSRSKALCVAHFFNHQAHHRGQVTAMLTAAGARVEETDLLVMPDEADWM